MKKLLLILFGTLFLTGCSLLSNDEPLNCDAGYHVENNQCVEDLHQTGSFENENDLLQLMNNFYAKQSLVTSLFFGNRFALDGAMLEESAADTNQSPTSSGSDDYSKTNNQVDGVDEMDNVLTDGKYLYISNYDKVQIVLAYTTEEKTDALDLVKEITFDSLKSDYDYFYFTGMYVDDSRLLIVGNTYQYSCDTTYKNEDTPSGDTDDSIGQCYFNEYHSSTIIYEYSKNDFTLKNTYELSGNYVGSRKIDNTIYFVTNEYIPYYYSEDGETTIDLDHYLPSYSINGNKTTLQYEDIMYIEGTSPSTFTTFYGINLDNQKVSSEVVLGEGGYNLYVSTENIYLTGTKWNFNNDILLKIEAEDEDYVPEENPYELSTSILRISINNGVVALAASGEVSGMISDQFSMDEKDHYVRIVTTEFNWWWEVSVADEENDVNNGPDNRLTILDSNLKEVSHLDDIGKPGESVQSVRFVSDYAYVVTYLQTDPFYVIDLSDPLNPKKLSELVIPGFSDYLQPIGENYMLGIGYGDFDGGTQGLKISLYDISDKTNAVVSDEIIYPYSNNSYMWTSTLYNHKDLLVSLEKGIIALPYTKNDWGGTDNNWWWSYTTGILVLTLNLEEGTISERGKVEHSESNNYDTTVYKSKFIDNYLYTISSKFVKVSPLDDPENILNELQIGSSIDLEVPYDVEPVDPD
jgi:uncharacterized secreted protein with C-terminal beta-propeller domain